MATKVSRAAANTSGGAYQVTVSDNGATLVIKAADGGSALASPDPARRLQAAQAVLKSRDASALPAIDAAGVNVKIVAVPSPQLFDLQADPFETKDLSAEPDQAARVKELLARLEVGLRAGACGAVGSGNGQCGGDRALHAHD